MQIKFLSGADGVDRWTEQSLWDSILSNVRVVVSTYQILADALTHGFVKIDSLALIVFDEGGFSELLAAMAQEITFASAQLCWETCWCKNDAELLPQTEGTRSRCK